MDDTERRAGKEVMKEMASENDRREQRLMNHTDGSVAKAVYKGCGRFA